jgi:NaMN:DMB phosphoribosyltransferase
MLGQAKPDETVLVDDLGGWITALLDPARQPNDDEATVAALAEAVGACRARLVVVSPEVGLSLVPMTAVGRAFADALGTANQALAAVCDRVVLVVAGQPTWLKGGTGGTHRHTDAAPAEPDTAAALGTSPAFDHAARPGSSAAAAAATHAAATPAASTPVAPPAGAPHDAMAAATPVPAAAAALAAHEARTSAARAAAEAAEAGHRNAEAGQPEAGQPEAGQPEAGRPATGGGASGHVLDGPTLALPVMDPRVVIEPGMDVPLPDQDAGPDAHDRLATLDLPGAGLGALREVVEFAAATQGTAVPRAWASVRVMVLHGTHLGGASAGADVAESARRAADAASGRGTLARLAAEAGADVQVVHTPGSAAMEGGPVLDEAAVEAALGHGWQLAQRAADDGRDAVVLASTGAGAEAAATAVLAATSGTEPAAVLPRVIVPGGYLDDAAWMVRCAAVRDAMHRIRQAPRGPKDVLAEVAGGDVAVATGILLGAASRRLPVLVDGPVAIAAALVARDLANQTRHWMLLTDDGNQALVRQGADILGLTPVLSLGLDLGEGANALATLPLLSAAIGLAAALPVHPALTAPQGDTTEPDLDPGPEGAGSEDAGSEDAGPEGAGPEDHGAGYDGAGYDGDVQPDDSYVASFAEPEPRGPGPASPSGA